MKFFIVYRFALLPPPPPPAALPKRLPISLHLNTSALANIFKKRALCKHIMSINRKKIVEEVKYGFNPEQTFATATIYKSYAPRRDDLISFFNKFNCLSFDLNYPIK